MPSLRRRSQQPTPVSPQVQVPGEFPSIPQSVIDRFPDAEDWQKRLNEFWTSTQQALQESQQQAANAANSKVVYSVESFLIYAKGGIPQPMFALDSTGVKLGDVLVVNTPGRKVYIGEGVYADANTPFYVDTVGDFSLGANLTWDAETSTLTITGTINATTGTIGGFTIGADYIRDTANSMGLASTVTGGDDVRFWAGATFANRATASFRVTESGLLVASNATISGTITSTSGTIGGFTIGSTTLSAGSGDNAISIDSAGSMVLGNATFGVNDATVVGSGFISCYGYSPNYYAKLSGLNGKLKLGTWTYAGSYTEATVVEINGTNGDYDSYGGIMTLHTAAAATRITLDGTNGNGTFVGFVRSNDKFNHNGTDGTTGSFDPTAITTVNVAGGIITGWS